MSLPSKLAGYFAAGVPVVAAVAADSEAGREVETSGAGVLVEPDKPEALLRATLDLAGDDERRRRIGAAGTAFADRELQPDATLDQMECLLESALAGGRADDRVRRRS
jgi:glycosyltransferase involved in cell wall biosynthesis